MQTSKVRYTKANGDISERTIIVVSNPRDNYLVYDVTKLTEKEFEVLKNALEQIEEFRENAIADFQLLTGIRQESLWRSFKPEGIEWDIEDDTV